MVLVGIAALMLIQGAAFNPDDPDVKAAAARDAYKNCLMSNARLIPKNPDPKQRAQALTKTCDGEYQAIFTAAGAGGDPKIEARVKTWLEPLRNSVSELLVDAFAPTGDPQQEEMTESGAIIKHAPPPSADDRRPVGARPTPVVGPCDGFYSPTDPAAVTCAAPR